MTETTSLLLNNKVFLLKLVSLLHITPLFLLVLLHSLVAGPLLQKVEDAYETSPSLLDPEDVKSLVTLEVPFFLAFSVLWIFQIATTIWATASAYLNDLQINTQPLDLKVVVLIWIKTKSTKVVLFRLFLFLMMIIILLVLAAAALFVLGKSNAVIRWVIVLVAAITYPYLASICALGLIISVLEESCLAAFQEGCNLVNHGRKLQTYVVMLILTLLSIPIHVIFYVTSMDDDDERTFVTGFPFSLVGTSFFCLANHFMFAVFTLLYLEIKHASPHGVDRVEEALQLCTDT
ncbi:OLC1v1015290C1 [Oldenlandia corymbosa var. corymbosa]|uniref:OLC1v1015290C1 n=1 Tax=Oldenlandia corymbosa var. corymbosa TaxID=529605 RepID=A0AAV1E6D9_OLDCO|nr:OLC1v1015290C1 [Oldenlandia corymbosa var. corymbosa]